MKDWTKLTAKERIDMIIAAKIEETGSVPPEVKVSNKLMAELFIDGHLDVMRPMDGLSHSFYKDIFVTSLHPQQPH